MIYHITIFISILFLISIFGILLLYIFLLLGINKQLCNNKTLLIIDIPDRKSLLIDLFTTNIVDINNSDKIIYILSKHKDYNILLDTNGGEIIENDYILNYILTSQIKLSIYVIRKALSAGCMLALTADKLYMNDTAVLGPTDPQLTIGLNTFSYTSIVDLINNKDINSINDLYLLKYYDDIKLYKENIDMIKKLLNKKFIKTISKANRNIIIDKLTSGKLSHHTPLSALYLKDYINIYTTIPNYVNNIYEMYYKILNSKIYYLF